MGDQNLQIIITASDKASGVVKNIGGALGNLGSSIPAIAAGATAAIAGLGAATVGLGAAALGLAVNAAPIQNIRAAFDGLTEAAGTSGDAVLSAMQEASGGMIEAEKLMTGFNKAAQLVSPDFALDLTKAMGPLQKVAASTGQSMDYMLDSLVTGIGRQSKMILDNLGITVDLEKSYEDYAAALGITKEELSDQQKQVALTNQVMELLAINTKDMPDITDSAAAGWARLKTTWEDSKDQLGLALLPLLESAIPILERMTPIIEDVIEVVGLFANGLAAVVEDGDAFNDWFANIYQKIPALKEPLRAFMGILQGVSDILRDGFPPEFAAQFQGIGDAIKNLLGAIQEQGPAFQEELEKIKTFFEENMGDDIQLLFTNLETSINALAEIWREHGDEIMEILRIAFEFIAVTVMGTINLIIGVVTAGLQILTGDFEGAGKTMENVFLTFFDSVAGIFGSSFAQVQAQWRANWDMFIILVGALWRNFVNWFNGQINTFINIGNRIMDGLVLGLRQNWYKVRDFFQNMINSMIDWVKRSLGISSPSSVFAEIGKQMTAGLEVGINAGASGPITAMAGATRSMVDNSVSQGFYGPINIQADNQSTLTGLLRELHTAAGVA